MSEVKVFTVALPWGTDDKFPMGQYVLLSEYERLRAAIIKACSDMGCYCETDPADKTCSMHVLEQALGSADAADASRVVINEGNLKKNLNGPPTTPRPPPPRSQIARRLPDAGAGDNGSGEL